MLSRSSCTLQELCITEPRLSPSLYHLALSSVSSVAVGGSLNVEHSFLIQLLDRPPDHHNAEFSDESDSSSEDRSSDEDETSSSDTSSDGDENNMRGEQDEEDDEGSDDLSD